MRLCTGLVIMGLGFTLGLLCGLCIQLPVASLPANVEARGPTLRFRRAAQVGNVGHGKFGDSGVADSGNYQQDGLAPGVANKQRHEAGLLSDYDPTLSKDTVNNGVPVVLGAKSAQLNSLDKYPHRNSDSLVYVNPIERKLIYNNNSTDPNQFKRPYVRDDAGLRNNDVPEVSGATDTVILQANVARGVDPSKVKVSNENKVSIPSESDMFTGVFWAKSVENLCPKGFTKSDHESWKHKANNEKIVKINEGCGRMQNRILSFQNSDKACARYRLNVDQIQGEIYSYYLSKLLTINNVPPSTLQLADTNSDQWSGVTREVANARWSEESPLILSRWISGMTPAYIPAEFRNQSDMLLPRSVIEGSNNKEGLCELLQWSDLIVFDYVTANLDRVVNNLFNLQWNDQMMSKPAHNLERTSDGHIVFIDNESGLFHGYRLLDKYAVYHQSLLQSLCVFKESTISAIRQLTANDSIGDELQNMFEENEPLHKHLPRIPLKNIKILKQRMNDVLQQVDKCQSITSGR